MKLSLEYPPLWHFSSPRETEPCSLVGSIGLLSVLMVIW